MGLEGKVGRKGTNSTEHKCVTEGSCFNKFDADRWEQ